ncbi:MAG TPA: DUF4292 domain-containing protein [Desulfuromonadales bacterium]|nr:DUF4292 domain-containing protein [Desulfuromonadales bacterium]
MKRFFLLLCLMLTACAPRAIRPPELHPVPATTLLASVSASGRAFHSLRGLAKVKVVDSGRTIGGTQVILAEKPDRLRAETLSPFGQPLLVLASDGRQLSILAPGEGRFYQGPATAQNLGRFTGFAVPLPTLVQILLYQVPVIAGSQQSVSITKDGRYRLTLQTYNGQREVLYFDANKRLVEMNYSADGELKFLVSWSRFTTGERAFPQAATLSLPRQQTEVSLMFTELKINAPIPAERFDLKPPAGVSIVDLP